MRQSILIIFILVFLMACGAQNKTSQNEETLDDTQLTTEIRGLTLPQTVSINFPSILSSINNDFFYKNIQNIEVSINLAKDKLNLLSQVMEDINKVCEEKIVCHIETNYFNENLGEITFTQDVSSEKYHYELSLKLNGQEMLIYKWSDITSDVVTVYKELNNQLSIHYFNDILENKEALYIDDSQSDSQNVLMVTSTENSNYRFRSNFISKDKSFSSNILIEDEVILEENENIYTLNNDFFDFEEGSYLLFSSMENFEKLNLVEVFEIALGSFLRVENRLEGFIYKNLENETVIPFRITALN